MLQILIIGLVVAIVLFSAQYGWTKTMNKALDIEGCRASVVKHSEKIAVPVLPDIDYGKQVKLDCSRHYITFYDDHVQLMIEGKEHEYKVSTEDGESRFYDKLTENIVNQVVAEEARWCLYKLGEYNIPIRHIKNCIFCAQFKFEEEVEKDKFTGMYDYLKNNDMPIGKSRKQTESTEKYLTYFSKTLKNGENTLKINPNLVFERGKAYITFYEIDGNDYYLHIGEISDIEDCMWYN